jgi:glucosamine--fructose-6-phosphate aminotransferase (isomerizing)
MVAKYWIENHSGLPVDLDIASEYRYKTIPVTQKSAALFISQSGETADTLAAMQHANAPGQLCCSLVKVTNSTMAQESDVNFTTIAGQEVGVASTKAFTTQLAVLATLSIAIAKNNGLITQQDASDALKDLRSAEQLIETVLKKSDQIRHIATELAHTNNAIYMGRGSAYPIALEGALKLKEISYIHAEAYPAGELKHGPIALIDKSMPVIVVAPNNMLFSKTLSNLREVASRGGKIILLSDKEGIEQAKHFIQHAIEVPKSSSLIEPILYNIPLQLLAYHVAVARGTDVDQPRNLAKSVTVE